MEIELKKEYAHEDILFSLVRGEHSWFAAGVDSRIYEFQVGDAELEKIKEFEGHTSFVTGLVRLNERLISVGYDRMMRVWDLETAKPISSMKAHEGWVRSLTVSSNNQWLATTADDMSCRIWDAKTLKLRHILKGHEEKTPQGFATMLYISVFSADGRFLATADRIGRVVVWEVESGKPLAKIEAPEFYTFDRKMRNRSIGGIRALAFSGDGSELAVGGIGQVGNVDGFDGKARIDRYDWRNEARKSVYESDRHKGIVEHLTYDGDSIVAAGGSGKGFFIVLNTTDGKALVEPETPMHVHDFLFSSPEEIVGVGHQKIARWQVGRSSA